MFETIDIPGGNSINHITELRNGKLAISTTTGLFLYNSNSFKSFVYSIGDTNTISDSYVNYVYQHKDDKLWVATKKGINLLENEFNRISIKELNQYSNSNIKQVTGNEKNVFFIADSLLIKYDPVLEVIDTLFTSKYIFKITLYKKELYVNTSKQLLKLNLSNNAIDTAYSYINKSYIKSAYINKNKLFITSYDWVGFYNIKNKNFRNLFNASDLKQHLNPKINRVEDTKRRVYLNNIVEYEEGYLLSTSRHGLFYYDNKTDKIVKNLNNKSSDIEGLTFMNTLFFDRINDDLIALGGFGNKIAIHNTKSTLFKKFKIIDKERVVYTFHQYNDDNMFFLNMNSYGSFNISSNQYQAIKIEGLDSFDIAFASRNKKEIIIKELRGGFSILNENLNLVNTISKKSLNLNQLFFTTEFVHNDSNIWIVANNNETGVYNYNRITKNFKALNLPLNHTWASITKLKDELLLGTSNGKIFSYNIIREEAKPFHMPYLGRLKSINEIIQIEDNKYVFNSYGFGIVIYNSTTKKVKLFTKKNGLASTFIYSIHYLNKKLWISSDDGISVIELNSDKVLNFDSRDGLLRQLKLNEGVWSDSKKNIYIGGYGGFNLINDSIEFGSKKNPFLVEEIKLGDKIQYDYSSKDKYVVDYDVNFFSVKFNRIDYGKSESILYRYRFKNLSSEWTNIGTVKELFWSNLAYGNYDVELSSTNRYGVWQDDSRVITFLINPPFWSSLWFIVLSSIVIIFIIGLYLYLLFKSKYEIEKIRVQISSDLHDDLGADLSKINMYSELMQHQEHFDDNSLILEKLSTISAKSISKLDDLVWAIDYRNDTLTNFIERLEFIAIEQLKDTQIRLKFIKDIKLNVRIVKSNIRTNMLYILKEAISNIVKYSGATYVEINTSLESNKFCLKIRDNGKPYEYIESLGNGIKNIKMRSKKIKATDFYHITSHGTDIKVEILL